MNKLDEANSNGFVLVSYQDNEFNVPFLEDSISPNQTNISIIIGPNGSGKSRALSRVVDELRYLNAVINQTDSTNLRHKEMPEEAIINYKIDGKNCCIHRKGLGVMTLSCLIDGKPTDLIEMPLPTRVATVSHLANDKFRFSNNDEPFYRYLGLRQASNLTTTGAIETKVIQSLINGFSEHGDEFEKQVNSWLSLAGFDQGAHISFELSSLDLLSEDFDLVYRSIRDSDKRRSPNSLATEKRFKRDVSAIHSLLSTLKYFQAVDGRIFRLSLSFFKSPDTSVPWSQGLMAARRWRIFKNLSLSFSRRNNFHDFSELSSGEQQLIGTSARLLAELTPYSLVIIDEPEVNLHPQWQINYIPYLRRSLKNILATHVVIATHSHFMISDLDKESSSLIVANGDSGYHFKLFDGDVYGRSPENILYRVFGVATTGNMYVENDLRTALQMISGTEPKDEKELKSIYSRLKMVGGSDNVAMNIILKRISSQIMD